MLEFSGQASGLQGFVPSPSTRVVAVAAQTPGTAAFQLLWLLSRSHWMDEGPMWILDGLAGEGDGDGLSRWLAGEVPERIAHGDIVAAHDGLITLCEQARREGPEVARRRLLGALPDGGVVLLCAPPDALAMLLMDSDARPLVALKTAPRDVVNGYNALKVLVQAGGVQPILVPLRASGGEVESDRAVQAVRQCCRVHLDQDVQSWPVAYHEGRDDVGSSDVSEGWWMRVLDSALAGPSGSAPAPRSLGSGATVAGVRSC